ncbi:MAG TPA: glycosyltransferase [Burkholderiaceae bacterium]|nr:glycosyltransferase [Burkholderiaceae bacterium]
MQANACRSVHLKRVIQFMHPPSISIALCTYQGACHLREQLDSLLAQDHPNLELVAFDDASTDGSWEILQQYAPRFTTARLTRNESTLGLRANFQQAFLACRGDWIAPCDQDDRWAPHKLSRLLHCALAANAVLAYGDSDLIDAQGQPMGQRISDKYHMVSGSDPRAFTFSNCVSGHAALFRRSLLTQVLPVPQGVYYDWWIASVAAATGLIVYVDEPLVQFRQHALNASGFAGQNKASAGRRRTNAWTEQRLSLGALADLPGPHQQFFRELLHCWTKERRSSLSPDLAALLYRHRHAVFAMKKSSFKARHVLKYLRCAAMPRSV